MATRSRIGIVNKDGSITSIYNHFDGYPQGVGVQLALNYGEKEAKRLIKLGNRSSLFAKPTKQGAYGNPSEVAQTNKGFKDFAEDATSSDIRYAYLGQEVPGYGFAWVAYSVEYGPNHDFANDVID